MVIMNDFEWPMLSYYVIYFEKFRKIMQWTEKETFKVGFSDSITSSFQLEYHSCIVSLNVRCTHLTLSRLAKIYLTFSLSTSWMEKTDLIFILDQCSQHGKSCWRRPLIQLNHSNSNFMITSKTTWHRICVISSLYMWHCVSSPHSTYDTVCDLLALHMTLYVISPLYIWHCVWSPHSTYDTVCDLLTLHMTPYVISSLYIWHYMWSSHSTYDTVCDLLTIHMTLYVISSLYIWHCMWSPYSIYDTLQCGIFSLCATIILWSLDSIYLMTS